MVLDIGQAVVSGTVAQNGATYGVTGRLGTKEALKAVDSLQGNVWSVALSAPTNGVAHPLMRGYSCLTVTAAKQRMGMQIGVLILLVVLGWCRSGCVPGLP